MSEPTNSRDAEHQPVAGQILYGVEQAARVLGISAKFLRVCIGRGELRTRRCGTRLLLHRRELEKFAEHDHSGIAT